jgi:integrase
VAEHLRRWLEGYVKSNCSPRTQDSYRSTCELHLIPALGQLQLKQLQPHQIQKYYGEACSKLSARSVHYHHRLLKESLKFAVRQGYLGRNVCEMVDPPKALKKTMRALTASEVEVLLDEARGDFYYPVIHCALSTGLRSGELLGLRWRDINLAELSLSVSQVLSKRVGETTFKEPKTAHSRRRVCLTPKLALFLKDYRAEREGLFLLLGKPLTLDSLVFAHLDGRPFDPSVLSHSFGKIAARAGLQGLCFHDLRHTFASLMLLRGAKPKVISECLGHSSVAFTMDTYSHIIEGMQEDAMALLDEVLPAGVNKTCEKINANLTPTL